MNRKTEIKYLFLYLILNLIAVLITLNFWWTDRLNLSFLKQESFLLNCKF